MSEAEEAARVEAANARFYRVFEAMNMAEMDEVWSHGPHVRCVHPGWRLLEGWDAVRASWEAIFAGGQEMRFSIGDVHVHVEGALGWVTCTESILSETGGTVAVTSLMTTNVFARERDEWRMVHHHASHVLARPAG